MILNYDYELIIIDRVEIHDDTSLLCRELGANYVNRTGGNKYGDAVRTGIQSSTGEIIIFMDADGSHDPCEIPKLMELVDKCDIVVSSRYNSLAKCQNSYIK